MSNRTKLAAALAALLAFVAVTAEATSARSGELPPPWCRPTNDATAQRFLARVVALATATDSDAVAMRDSLSHMPQTTVGEVALVANDSLCQRASSALDTAFYTAPRHYPVYLAKAGARYIAFPPGHAGEFGTLVHMDTTFRVLVWSTY